MNAQIPVGIPGVRPHPRPANSRPQQSLLAARRAAWEPTTSSLAWVI